MVRVWVSDVTSLMEAEGYKRYYDRVPCFRKEKADGLKQMSAKAQSIGAWILWEKIRAEYDLPESSLFNLSHSDRFVMCAVHFPGREGEESREGGVIQPGKSSGEQGEPVPVQLGCDLEKVGELRLNVARRFFCPPEYETILAGQDEEERRQRFYRYWVLKESFMKATRKGMALPLDSFCVRLGDPPVLVSRPVEYPQTYYYREYSVEGIPCRMAVCTTDQEIDSEIHLELKL